MSSKENTLRSIPQVEKILSLDAVSPFIPIIGRSIVVNVVRKEIESFREKLDEDPELAIEDLLESIVTHCERKRLEKLQRVINGTGVIIHTNLGRSPISHDILQRLTDSLAGYCNLELYLAMRMRGKRGGFAEELFCNLTDAEDALIVNNNASCVFLILNEFARGREVIVSRGELIQIGGGFRIPDIMHQTGAKLVEVGTTNITELDDVRQAINENTAMILSAHQSNFRMYGFTKRPTLRELADLLKPGILLVRDLGSGNLVTGEGLPKPFEPTITFELTQGPDLVCFSGDKLLGGCQAGIVLGRREHIQRLRKNPLMRMIRVDKITYFLLQETLLYYVNEKNDDISVWNIIMQSKEVIRKRVRKFLRRVDGTPIKEFIEVVPVKSTFGGGSLPGVEIDSFGIQVVVQNFSADEIHRLLITGEVPIVGYILNDRYTLDFRTIFDRDIEDLVKAMHAVLKK
jgi:L-seryl-tRNA(Ser) seleniumtransferase